MLIRCCWLWFKECCSSIVSEIHKDDLEASLMLFRLPLLSPYIYALWGKAHVDSPSHTMSDYPEAFRASASAAHLRQLIKMR